MEKMSAVSHCHCDDYLSLASLQSLAYNPRKVQETKMFAGLDLLLWLHGNISILIDFSDTFFSPITMVTVMKLMSSCY